MPCVGIEFVILKGMIVTPLLTARFTSRATCVEVFA